MNRVFHHLYYSKLYALCEEAALYGWTDWTQYEFKLCHVNIYISSLVDWSPYPNPTLKAALSLVEKKLSTDTKKYLISPYDHLRIALNFSLRKAVTAHT